MKRQSTRLFCSVAIVWTWLAGPVAGAANGVAQTTPLVLKDGRIANVSVHTIPFQPGTAELSAGGDAQLSGILIPAATDCFLTAQAIGHVEPEASGEDALDGHRLARARADAIQSRLVDLGLPAASIASVWDWQFQVRDASATLWLFELAKGDDCEGTPLEGARVAAAALPAAPSETKTDAITPAVVTTTETSPPAREVATIGEGDVTGALSRQATAATSPPQTPAAQPEPVPSDSVAVSDPASPSTAPIVETEVAPPAEQAERPGVQAMLAEARRATQQAAADLDKMQEPEPATEPAPNPPQALSASEPEPAPVAVPAAKELAATPKAESETVPEAVPEEVPEEVDVAELTTEPAPSNPFAASSSASVAVVFDLNSSWVTPRQAAVLDEIAASLPASGPVELRLTAAVGAGDVNSKSPVEDAKYNRWMAERRIAKVEGYLADKAGNRDLRFIADYRAGDNSRAVEVLVAPKG